MNMKWCAFTGALMLLFVVAALTHQVVSQDPPGVTSRWWDGTRQSVEKFYDNGKPSLRIEYGDDGKTVLSYTKWSRNGAVVLQKQRQEDGTLEEKEFTDDGKTLLHYVLWNGDGQSFRIEREYSPYPDSLGKLTSEEVKTPDGRLTIERRSYYPPGVLSSETKILDDGWGDNQNDSYSNGKLVSRSILRGSGDQIQIRFHDNGTMASRSTVFAFNHSSTGEFFDDQGRPTVMRETSGDHPMDPVVSLYHAGKLKYKQVFNHFSLERLEEYREDGTLARVKHFKDGKIVREEQFDGSGKTVVSEKSGGKFDSIDGRLLESGDSDSSIRERGI
jgi:antitoxin component YwqK of YwqJK toxin-antitoxin module